MKFIGGKWKAVILIHLFNKKRYNELRKQIPMVTERTLSLQLKELEEDGLISRTVFTKKPPLKVEYELTELGKTLIPLLNEISNWGKFIAEEHLHVKIESCITDLKS
ncbi:HxlR family transcriptional regulator [Flavobacterium columnare ATCC 49512]|uniref:HxlR family transcriptional regulator n=2 Tax=Flavobacterium columnare TaxID=996 RepID=G8X5G4_FLACA|nr:HxlR family transcriptional regulator [Flavobacterium columnare ATCC 49512]